MFELFEMKIHFSIVAAVRVLYTYITRSVYIYNSSINIEKVSKHNKQTKIIIIQEKKRSEMKRRKLLTEEVLDIKCLFALFVFLYVCFFFLFCFLSERKRNEAFICGVVLVVVLTPPN